MAPSVATAPAPPTPAAMCSHASSTIIASREDVHARAAVLGRGEATTGFKRFLALTEAAAISATRHRRHTTKKHHQVSLPLSPGSDYTLTFTLNSQTLSVYMDTRSGMVWFPYSPFECILCEGQYPPETLSPLNISLQAIASARLIWRRYIRQEERRTKMMN